MNRLYKLTSSLLALLALGMIATSCSPKEESLFEEPSSPRLNKAVLQLKQSLTSASDGWILEYIPDQKQQFGGFVMLLKFEENGTVSILNELNPSEGEGSQPSRSDYGFDKDKGVVLTFPSYNTNLHYFADPDINDGYGRGAGFQGDYAFLVSPGASDKEYILEGKYSKNKMRLFQPEGGATAYFNGVKVAKESYQISEFDAQHKDAWVGTLGGKEVELKYDYFFNTLTRVSDDPAVDDEVIPYVWTPTGIRLIKPLEGVDNLTWDSTKLTWTSGSEVLTMRDDPIYPAFSEYLGTYLMTYTNVATTKVETKQVTLEKQMKPGYYITCKGLSYDLTFDYLPEEDAIHIGPQVVTQDGVGYYLVLIDNDFYLTQNSAHGYVSKKVNHPQLGNILMFEDNKKWGKPALGFMAITSSYNIANTLQPFFFKDIILIKR